MSSQLSPQQQLARVMTHYWLRHTGDTGSFHAYETLRNGARSLCQEGEPFFEIADVDVPGERSLVCVRCCQLLYGTIGHHPPTWQDSVLEGAE